MVARLEQQLQENAFEQTLAFATGQRVAHRKVRDTPAKEQHSDY